MHFFLQGFPNYKNSYLIRLICHIFGISTVNFRISTVNFSPFQGPNRFVALLPWSDKIFQYHIENRMLRFFITTLPVKLFTNTCQATESYDDSGSLYSESNFFRTFYHGWSDHQEIHPPSFREFPPDTLKMPRTTCLESRENDFIFSCKNLIYQTHGSPPSFLCFKEVRHRPVTFVILLHWVSKVF